MEGSLRGQRSLPLATVTPTIYNNAGFSGAPLRQRPCFLHFVRGDERCRNVVPSPYRSRNATTTLVPWDQGFTFYWRAMNVAVLNVFRKCGKVIPHYVQTVVCFCFCFFFTENTVKSFHFAGMLFRGFTTLDMFVDTLIRGFQIIFNTSFTKVNDYFVGILILWIALFL